MGLFDFFEAKKPQRRRRSAQGPIECLPPTTTAKPLPSFNKSRVVNPAGTPQVTRPSTVSLSDSSVSDSSVSDSSGSDRSVSDSVAELSTSDTAEFIPSAKAAEVAPRFFHHGLIHAALRELVFTKPAAAFKALSSNEAGWIIDELLRRLGRGREAGDERPDFSSADVRLRKVRAGESPCVIVEMPPPRAATEAYFAAVLVKAQARTLRDQLTPHDLRYITLEMSAGTEPFADSGSTPATMIGEWTLDGVHRSYGRGPAPQLEKFLYTLSGMER